MSLQTAAIELLRRHAPAATAEAGAQVGQLAAKLGADTATQAALSTLATKGADKLVSLMTRAWEREIYTTTVQTDGAAVLDIPAEPQD